MESQELSPSLAVVDFPDRTVSEHLAIWEAGFVDFGAKSPIPRA